MIRPATPDDAAMIARINVQAWAETYPGMLPDSEIARRTYDVRLEQWTKIIDLGQSRINVLPDLGFAQVGPQRSPDWAEAGYGEELYALYLLQSAHGLGHGRALLETTRSAAGFTALVLDANHKACQFYERSGGILLKTLDGLIGEAVVRDRVYGWAAL
jgi:GNAT superfamily N-acetyltransferase